MRSFTKLLLDVDGVIEITKNVERLQVAHVQYIGVLQSGVISCFLVLRNADLELGLLLFEPAVMVKDELLHLFEELKSATIDSLH